MVLEYYTTHTQQHPGVGDAGGVVLTRGSDVRAALHWTILEGAQRWAPPLVHDSGLPRPQDVLRTSVLVLMATMGLMVWINTLDTLFFRLTAQVAAWKYGGTSTA